MNNRTPGKQRAAMEEAVRMLAKQTLGRGIPIFQALKARSAIAYWQKSFINYMKDKVDSRGQRECITQIQRRLATDLRGKKLLCKHNHILGEKGARALAENIILSIYEIEARALGACIDEYYYREENRAGSDTTPAIDPYFTRDAGPVEWGHSMSEEAYLPRNMAEVPTGPEYDSSEDEHALSWRMSDKDEFTSDDEIVDENESDFHSTIDWSEMETCQGELLSQLIRATKKNESLEPILNHAKELVYCGSLTWWHMKKLRETASVLQSK